MSDQPTTHRNEDLRAQLAQWDADYNRNAGPPRPDDRKDTTTDD